MSSTDPRLALVVGLVAGLLISGAVISFTGPSGNTKPLTRPDGVPDDAVWLEDAFGGPRWVRCRKAEKDVTCHAYSKSGDPVLVANYVPRRGASHPDEPFEHVVARDVEGVWLNKVAMVPDGTVLFPHASLELDYAKGERLNEPR